MPIVYQATDSDEYWHDTDAEQMGNLHLYGVISGCAPTEDAADLTVDLAAGTILHNALAVAVTAQTNGITLVADSSNERWSYLTVNSSGTATLVSGDAAPNGTTEPTKPELGDRVLIKAYKVEAAQTIAANISVALDKRTRTHSAPGPVGSSATATSTTSTSAVDLVTISGLNIPVTSAFRITFNYRKQALAANAVTFGLKLNSTVVLEAAVGSVRGPESSATNRAEDGYAWIEIGPRPNSSYSGAMMGLYETVVTATGNQAVSTVHWPAAAHSAAIPVAAITSIAIRAINDTASNAAEVFDVRVYEIT